MSASTGSSSTGSTTLDLGASVGIAVAFAFFASLLVTAGVYWYFNRQKRRPSHNPYETETAWHPVKCETPGRCPPTPNNNNRFGSRVLSVFAPALRKPASAQQQDPLVDAARSGRGGPGAHNDELDEFRRKPVVELAGRVSGNGQATGAMASSPFEEAPRQVETHGPVPPYSSSGAGADQDLRLIGPTQSIDLSTLALAMPPGAATPTPRAAWQSKRTGPPPPLTIAPPVHSRSTSDGYSTYTTTRSPYDYYSLNLPPLPSASSLDRFTPSLPGSSLHSSDSTRSDRPLQRLPPPSTPGSLRSDHNGAQQAAANDDAVSLRPTTPTRRAQPAQSHTQTQRIPSDTTNFVCLGPLPANIPMPSPEHFMPERQRSRSPPSRALAPMPSSFSASAAASPSPVYAMDPLLHASDPFRTPSLASPSPVDAPTFSEAHSLPGRDRRPSTDSLGSNFTVEEEERIQAEIVRNLEMLGRQRVGGGEDIVHIPQISGRRYSWEDN